MTIYNWTIRFISTKSKAGVAGHSAYIQNVNPMQLQIIFITLMFY